MRSTSNYIKIKMFFGICLILCLSLQCALFARSKQKNYLNLVQVTSLNPRIQLDLRYATENNFLGFAIYPQAVCYLHEDAAEALCLVQEDVESLGYSLKIFDGYRPLHAQQTMWDLIQDERYVSNPAVNKGRHTRGTAVDLTLVDASGKELEMPSDFDDFTEKAHSDYAETSDEAKKNRALLKLVMETHGFKQFEFEWWHFDLEGWQDDLKYPPRDVDFAELENHSLVTVLPYPFP